MKNLVIVESPTKARTIGKFLGNDYTIKASMGHVMDLPKSTLGVDVEHDFAPQFEVISDKKKVISELKSAAKDAQEIILATDPDREGEAIASHVKDVLVSSNKQKAISNKFKRIVFHEITREAIKEALGNPRSIDNNLVDAQTARRVLDRLVGYKLSPLLWQKVRRGLSAGRVQSVALRLIVEREREIEKFKKEVYWTITATLRSVIPAKAGIQMDPRVKPEDDNKEIAASPSTNAQDPRNDSGTIFDLIEINNEKIELQETFQLYDGEYKVTKTTIEKEDHAKRIMQNLQGKTFTVADVLQKEMRRSPSPPYTTSTLQQDASHRLGLNGKRTMSLAQKLYEEGHITYHRTDSVVMAISAQNMIRSFVQKEYGDKYLPEKPRFYTTKQKLAQEAHESIRPTRADGIQNSKFKIQNEIGNQYWKLYELIWKRAVASQMSDAIIESTTVLADASSSVIPSEAEGSRDSSAPPPAGGSAQNDKEGTYRFKANGSVLIFEGFLKVNPQALQDNRLPQFSAKQNLDLLDAQSIFHETPPPPRYNDASLIKTLEEKGIGRPSTYATIVSTIESRQYIERQEGRFVPTSVGNAVTEFLVKNFPDIDDIPFTAEMEDSLDQIADGKKEWVPMMKAFYKPFEKKLESVKEDSKRVRIEVEELKEKCPTCGNPLVVRLGRFGKFISCSTFPTCKFSKPFVEETNFTCPKCPIEGRQDGKVIVKKTRRGRKFFGCSNYPNCNFAAWKLEDIRNYDPNKPKKTFTKRKESKK